MIHYTFSLLTRGLARSSFEYEIAYDYANKCYHVISLADVAEPPLT